MLNLTQMKYFLEVARCQSISLAAEHLFITQPTLGRQMTAMENELNMQLFLRSYKGVQLTPAGKFLEERFTHILEYYENSVEMAKNITRGYDGKLALGILEGLNMDAMLAFVLNEFKKDYPNIGISIQSKSFGELTEDLLHGRLDVSLSLDTNFFEEPKLATCNIKTYQPAFAVPVSHPLAQKDQVSFADFYNYPLAIVATDDCFYGVEFLKKRFRAACGFVPQLQYASRMQDVLLWVESGQTCALLNMEMKLASNPLVKMYPFEDENPNYIQAGFSRKEKNPIIDILLLYLKKSQTKES